ncbi:hypothetical protein BGX24_011470 [Mortierella sp. AD032]|nr:hypothetical protein BGX24_011470 [Mortierella sp. AD032]
MSNFTLDARLDTPNPFLIEFLGPPSAVVHKIAGKLVMTVTKSIQLKQLSVAFVGQATTDPTTLNLTSISWEHFLVSSAIPVGLMSRRKEFRKKIELKRVQVEPSSNALSRFGSSRTDQIDCSIHTYKCVGLQQDRLKVKLYMHAYSSQYRVKEILVGAVQTEWVDIEMSSHDLHKRGKRFV